MGNILILPNTPIAAVGADRGTGAANLMTRSPKEVWADTADGSIVRINIDFGVPILVDTVFLGFVSPPIAGATWSAVGGLAAHGEFTVFNTRALRAVDSATRAPARTHALWNGAAQSMRYLRLLLTQPAAAGPLSAGIVMAGEAWRPTFNMEFGSGRRVIDTGTVAQLADGGFAAVEGARKRQFDWTLGDLSRAETDELEELLLDHGESVPLLVVEDPDATTGQRNRIHYGLFVGLKAYERANSAQTKYAFSFEEWI